MKDRIPICAGFICITGDKKFLEFNGTQWDFHGDAYEELMTRCSDAGVSIVRKMLWSPFGKEGGIENMFQPYSLAGQQFELDAWNDWYWDYMLQMQFIDKKVNITNRYDIADNCDFASGDWYKYVPWMNNVQGIHTLYQKEAYPHYEKLFRKTVSMMGADQIYSPGNEMNHAGFVPIFTGVVCKLVKEGVLAPERLAYGPHMPDANYANPPVWQTDENGKKYLTYYPDPIAEGTLGQCKKLAGGPPTGFLDEKSKLLIYRDVHSVGSPPYDNIREFGPREHQMITFWGKYPIRAWASTDGKKLDPSDPRASKCDKDFDGARISADTWHLQAHHIIKGFKPEKFGMKQCIVLEHCPQTTDTDCLVNTFKAISRAVEEETGTKPENLGKFPYAPPEPPEPPQPPQPPLPSEPPDSSHKINWRWVAVAALIVASVLMLIFL